ncbi:MAG: DUF4142 domain-containing protein [Hyphomicrobiales bacterium]|nr:MAG: DUF4142 domain-containing protein [Hyphomicrobiales bacterium]
MRRRSFLLGSVLASVGVSLRQPVFAQGQDAAAQAYVTDTLHVGTLSLVMSRLAVRQAQNKAVKAFAGFEVSEQEALSDVLHGRERPLAMTGNEPAPTTDLESVLTDRERQEIAQLRRLSGQAFDQAYLNAQGNGHNQLLAIQERLLAGDAQGELRAVAILTRTVIKEHLVHLKELRGRR